MDFLDTPAEAAFRDEVRTWLADHLVGEFAELGGGGGPSDETAWELRVLTKSDSHSEKMW